MTYRQLLRDLAFDQHGVVTTGSAGALGVPAVEVRKLAARGALKHLGRGVYRMLEVPPTQLSEFAEAVALVGPDAVLADEGVLAALGLAQVELKRVPVATGRRVRSTLPMTVDVVHRVVPDEDRDYIDGVPAMSVVAALRAARGGIMNERLVEATRTAARRGLIGPADEVQLLAELQTT